MKKIIDYLKVKLGDKNFITNNYRIIILSVLSIMLVSVLLLSSTYSLFKASNKDENLNVYKTGVLDVTYTLSEDNVVLSEITPTAMEDINTIVPYRITVSNMGNVPYMFDLKLESTTATNAIDYQYVMVQVGVLDEISFSSVTDSVIKGKIIVPAGESVDIDVRVWLSDTIPNSQIGKSFYAKLSVDGVAVHSGDTDIDNSKLALPAEVFDYTGDVQTFTATTSGYYKLEAWGAQGGHYDSNDSGGKGAYTSGEIYLEKGTELYIYVGGYGPTSDSAANGGGYNGGGYSGVYSTNYGYGGGGATDFRLVGGTWNDFDSLKSRIMVAAGGGGSMPSSSYTVIGGYGGTLVGGDAIGDYDSPIPTGATQTSSGTGYETGRTGFFGYGIQSNTSGWGGGGGGGYYAGVTGYGQGGSGGSSFVSGHQGCKAIAESSTSGSITHFDTPTHYSGYKFINSSMISGADSMPTHDGSSLMVGNEGNGYARISYVRDRSVMETYLGHTGDYQTYEVLETGYYQIEAWGAEGGASMLNGGTNSTLNGEHPYCESTVKGYCHGGHGAYTSGKVYLEKGTKLYAYVGGKGQDAVVNTMVSGGYNGGGTGDYDHSDDEANGGGGGATDIRIVSGSWNNFNSLKSRLMVAGGGGGSADAYSGLPGGDLSTTKTSVIGYTRSTALELSTQVSGYRFGVGQDGVLVTSNYPVSGGGGGYYGGYAPSGGAYDEMASGGSSYVSGYPGAVAAGDPQKFTFEYSATGVVKGYDEAGNEILSGTTTGTIPSVERTLNYLGKSNWSANGYFSGQMFKFKITLADGTEVIEYDFTKNTDEDLSGNGYDATLMNGAAFVDDGVQTSLYFDGVDDYVQVPTLPDTIYWNGGFTVEVELIFHQLTSYARVFDFGNGAPSNNIIVQVYQTYNQFDFMAYNGTTSVLGNSAVDIINLNGTKIGKDNSICETGDSDISCSYHYSGYIFEEPKMINGNSSQPTYDGNSTQTGNIGNGYLKIKYLRE